MQEESKNKKTKWGKPKLIILTRGKSEGHVLLGCKGSLPGTPGNYDSQCEARGPYTPYGYLCASCTSRVAS